MLSIVLVNFFNCLESAISCFDYEVIHRSCVGADGRAGDDGRAGACALGLSALGQTSSPSLGALECSRLPPAIALRGPRLRGEQGTPLQRDNGDPAASAQWVGADHDSCDWPPLVGQLGDHRHAGDSYFLYSAPVGGSSVRVWVDSRTRSGRPSVAQQEGQRGHDCDPRPRRSATNDRVVLDALYASGSSRARPPLILSTRLRLYT
jgi:hypothetical protein